MILPDSNVWIYGIDTRADKHPPVREWFERSDEEGYLVPSLVQLEILHYLSRNVGDDDARSPLVQCLFSFPSTTRALTPATVRSAYRSLEDHLDLGIGARGAALLVHAMEEDATLVTHDQALFQAAMRVDLDAHDPAAEATGS